jgi:hypothetical protein
MVLIIILGIRLTVGLKAMRDTLVISAISLLMLKAMLSFVLQVTPFI